MPRTLARCFAALALVLDRIDTRIRTKEDVEVADLDAALSGLEVDSDTFCIIVTRGHNHDEEALYHLAETPAGYVGLRPTAVTTPVAVTWDGSSSASSVHLYVDGVEVTYGSSTNGAGTKSNVLGAANCVASPKSPAEMSGCT